NQDFSRAAQKIQGSQGALNRVGQETSLIPTGNENAQPLDSSWRGLQLRPQSHFRETPPSRGHRIHQDEQLLVDLVVEPFYKLFLDLLVDSFDKLSVDFVVDSLRGHRIHQDEQLLVDLAAKSFYKLFLPVLVDSFDKLFVDFFVDSLDETLELTNLFAVSNPQSLVPRLVLQIANIPRMGDAGNLGFDLVEGPEFVPHAGRNSRQQLDATLQTPC